MIIADIDRVLHGYDRRYRWRLALVMALAAIQTALVVLRPLPIKFLVETPVPGSWEAQLRDWAGGPDRFVYVFAGLVLAIELLILLFRLSAEFRSTRLSERFIRRIRADVAANLLQAPYIDVAKVGVGRVLAAVVGDVSVVQQLIKDVVVAATLAAFQLVLMLGVVYVLKPVLFWILVVEIILLSSMILVYSNWRKGAYLGQMKNQETFLGWVSNLYLKNLDLRFSQARTVFFGRTMGGGRTLYRTGIKLWLVQSTYSGLVEFFMGLSSAACLIYLVLESRATGAPLGNLLVFLYYTMLVFPALSKVGESIPLMTDARNAYDRLLPLLSLKNEIEHRPAGEALPRFGKIEFRNVGLQSDTGDWILRGVSFTINPGDHVSLFGDSGTGKSTLLLMLLGLVRPTEGHVFVEGRDVDTLTLADRKRLMLYQRSQAAFFNGTVAENVALGRGYQPARLDRTIEESRLANRLAAAGTGIDTPMSERGEPFSQGEQQRIAITRSFLSDRPCVILDEALNSLDEEGELAIVKALDATLAGRTLIMISHRRIVADQLQRLFLLRRVAGKTTFEEIRRA